VSDDGRLDFATLDLDRERRQGLPEIVYGPGKEPDQIRTIVAELLARTTGPVLVTRVDPTVAAAITGTDGTDDTDGSYDPAGRLVSWRPAPTGTVRVTVITAGTADGPVAAEAVAVARAVGLAVEQIHDVGVAGLHRLLDRLDDIRRADLLIVVAGMEGALPSVVAGLVGVPVVAVPTSVGYGASLDGVTPLLAMMSSCAAGITVVNIDSGFGAALAAHRLAFARVGRSTP
jgi:pyridinium-3,5-biscarboxylic acid mononucleotide synthase